MDKKELGDFSGNLHALRSKNLRRFENKLFSTGVFL